MAYQQSRGQDAENCACTHLEQQGLHLLTRNYRSRLGEIDLIMQDRDSLRYDTDTGRTSVAAQRAWIAANS